MPRGPQVSSPRSLESVYQPIQRELSLVEEALKALAKSFGFSSVNKVVDHFFQKPGKLLRPALALFAARAVSTSITEEKFISLGVALELIHSASLVHDDILDEDISRRGQTTLNGVWGNKVALLAGDIIYSRAYGLLTQLLPKDDLLNVVTLNEYMISAEVEQARTTDLSREAYYRIIEGKTARFMSLCCQLGASLGGATSEQKITISEFGLKYGLAYQLFDDAVDQDLNCAEVDPLQEGQVVIQQALEGLTALPSSEGRSGLEAMARYSLEMATP
ncbi:MAG: polyprenyl synthetase family protein [Spirochaetales bacterium]|nr:polyprenyl synthetase family protein [Spirochaetales bacterium]